MQVYLEGTDEEDIEAESKILPVMQEGDKVQLEKLEAIQHFTQPRIGDLASNHICFITFCYSN